MERSLYQRAVGYENRTGEDIHAVRRDEPVYAPFVAKVAPDVTATIFWLKNRRGEEWRDKQQHEHTGKDGGAIVIEQAEADAASFRSRLLRALPPDQQQAELANSALGASRTAV